ncbi:MAG: hypothetical protein AB7G15_03440 [Alphaproteobacteria bacterium]
MARLRHALIISTAMLVMSVAACAPGNDTSTAPGLPTRTAIVEDSDQAARFAALRASDEYVRVIHERALNNDRKRNAQCTDRRIQAINLDQVTRTAKFFQKIKFPLEGAWSERVTVDSCGQPVDHKIHVIATLRGMLAVAPPGESLTDLSTQLDIARALTTHEQARADSAQCPEWRINNATIAARPDRQRRWRERWTIDSCGNMHNYLIYLAPGDTDGTIFRIRPEAR